MTRHMYTRLSHGLRLGHALHGAGTERTVARCLAAAASVLLSIGLAGCGAGSAAFISNTAGPFLTLSGTAMGGQQPVVGATIQLYAAGTTGDALSATPLIGSPAVTSGTSGGFSITGRYTCPTPTSEVYIVASGGNPGTTAGTYNNQLVLLSALGPCGNLSSSTYIVINEASTIGSIYPIAPFMSSYVNVGSSATDLNGLTADFSLVNEYINTATGQAPGLALPAGSSVPVQNLYTLANVMSVCINSAGGVAKDGTPCGKFLQYATPPGGTPPTNTADAILDIANNPNNNAALIYSLAPSNGPFQPTLTAAPADWTLPIQPSLTLSTQSPLVGIGSPNTGTFTLGQPAPAGGLAISLVSSNPAAITVVPLIAVAPGVSSGTFTYTGVAAGSATLMASATGYISNSVTLSTATSLITLGAIPTLAPGQTVSLPLSLSTPAPAGGVTVTFTSSNPGVATVSPASMTIAAGQTLPAANPTMTGATVGSTQVIATATGYAPAFQTVSVSGMGSLPDQTITLPAHTVTLSGSSISGTIASYAWTETTSTGATILTPTSTATTVTDLSLGTHTFTLTVTSTAGTSAIYGVNVFVNPDTRVALFTKKIVVLGSSTAAGYGATTFSNSWVGLYTSYLQLLNPNDTVIDLGVPGYDTYDILPTNSTPPANRPSPDTSRNITAALALHPDAIIVNMPTNDVAYGYSIAETEANFLTVTGLANAAGVPIWVTTTQPRNLDAPSRTTLMTERDWIYATYGTYAIDFWDTVANADGTINVIYGYGDGIHLNNLGHQKLYNRTADSGLIEYLVQ